MAVTLTYDGFLNRLLSGYGNCELIDGENATATSASLLGGVGTPLCQKIATSREMPTLPSGISAYVPTSFNLSCSFAAKTVLFGRGTYLGKFDNSSNTFTDGNAMPLRKVMNVSNVKIASPVMAYVTTTFNATPGSLSITYNDQDNNTAQSTTAVAITASAAVGTANFVNLSAGDWGVVDITAATRTGGTGPYAGVMEFWGIEPLGLTTVSPQAAQVESHQSFLTAGNFIFQRWAAGDQLFVWSLNSASANRALGDITFVGDST